MCGLFIYLDNREKEIHIEVSLVEMSESDFESPDSPPLVSLPAANRAAPPTPKSLDLPEAPAMEEVVVPEMRKERADESVDFELPEIDKPIFEEIVLSAPEQAHIEAKKTELLSPIRPKYPRASRRRGEEGVVQVEVTVDERGQAEAASVHVSSGFKELDEAALEAVKAAKFTPQEAKIFLSIDFRLKQ